MPAPEALEVVLAPETASQAIIKLGPAGFVSGQSEAAPDLICGSCGNLLARGMQPEQFEGTLLLECGQCSSLNLASGNVTDG